MSIPELERNLSIAQEHLKTVLAKGNGNTLKNYSPAFELVASAQRALAAAKGEEYAEPHDIGFTPEAAVSEALLITTEHIAILTFRAKTRQADGTYRDAGHGVVEIEGYSLTKFGYPNDEALPGHPLYNKGLRPYGVHEVKNSSWIRLQTEQNRVAFSRTPDSTQKHFIFLFHDSTFECIADSLRPSLTTKPYAEVFDDIRKKVLQHVADG
jgi:hypothetical protein